MNEDELARLNGLRSKILNELRPLIETADVDPEQKFNVSLAIARTSGEIDSYETAYKVAQDIDSAEQKMGAFLDLLEAVDIQSGAISANEVDNITDSSE
jgi:hypothetical protein